MNNNITKEILNNPSIPTSKLLIITSIITPQPKLDTRSILINRIVRFLESPTTAQVEFDSIIEFIRSSVQQKDFKIGDIVFYGDRYCFCRINYISTSKTHVDLQVLSAHKSNSRRMLDTYFNIRLNSLIPLKEYFLNREVFYSIGGISDIYKVTNVFGKELEITHLTKSNFKTTVQYTAVTLCDENVTCSSD